MKMKTGKSFADYYLNGGEIPLVGDLILQRKPQNNIHAIKKLNLKPDTKKGLYKSLHELMLSNAIARSFLRRYNREIVKERRDTIKYLQKASAYSRLSENCRSSIKAEIERLSKLDSEKQSWHPHMEIDYFLSVIRMSAIEKKLETIEAEKRIPPDLEEMALNTEHAKLYQHLKNMEERPMSFKGGRPEKIFFKALLIVIYRLLLEGRKITKKRARSLTANIINEYSEKDPLKLLHKIKNFKIPRVTAKDVENAVH